MTLNEFKNWLREREAAMTAASDEFKNWLREREVSGPLEHWYSYSQRIEQGLKSIREVIDMANLVEVPEKPKMREFL